MPTCALVLVAILLIYITLSFGKIAAKHGRNPILFGILSIVQPVNLIILGYWGFSDFEAQQRE